MKENDFTLKQTRSRRYSAENMTDADNIDDLVILANTPTEAESLLHSLEQRPRGIGFCVNAD